MSDFLVLFAFGSSCSLITIGFGYLFERKDKADFAFSFSLCFLWGVVTLFLLYMATGLYKSYPQFLYLSEPFELFLGPLVYYRFRLLIEGKFKFDRLALLLFLPGFLAVLYFIPFFALSPAEKLASLGFHNMPNGIARLIYIAIAEGQTPWFVFCVVLFIVQVPKILSEKGIRLMMKQKTLVAYTLLWVVIAIAGYIWLLLGQSAIVVGMVILTNYLIIFFHFIERKYASYFAIIQRDASETRYKRSMLGGVDTSAITQRLRELMELEQLYLDPELSLQSLSSRLEITSHQLSEILNDRLSTSFRSFVNAYRIEEAKRMLLDSGEQSILMVAFLCGFNSKNAFYTAFHKQEGMTPSDFRENK